MSKFYVRSGTHSESPDRIINFMKKKKTLTPVQFLNMPLVLEPLTFFPISILVSNCNFFPLTFSFGFFQVVQPFKKITQDCSYEEACS